MEYQQKVVDACTGKTEFPKGRAFGKMDTTTGTVPHDSHAATTEQVYDLMLFVVIAPIS